MAEAQRGTVFVAWGIVSTLTETAATGSGIGTMTVQSGTFKKESEAVETKNGIGQTVNKTFFNFKHMYTLNVTPTAATITLAKAANIIPKPGAIITVADADDPEVDATNGGKFLVLSSSKSKDGTKPTDFTCELEQFVDTDIAVVSA